MARKSDDLIEREFVAGMTLEDIRYLRGLRISTLPQRPKPEQRLQSMADIPVKKRKAT